MGANLYRNGSTVLVTGVRQLIGAPVMASDLRASAGLVLAGLAARGTTVVNRVYHLDRGYGGMEQTLQALGADIERVNVSSLRACLERCIGSDTDGLSASEMTRKRFFTLVDKPPVPPKDRSIDLSNQARRGDSLIRPN